MRPMSKTSSTMFAASITMLMFLFRAFQCSANIFKPQRVSIPLIVYVHNAAAIGGNSSAIGMVILEASIALIIHLGYNSTRCGGLRNGRIIAVIVVIGVFKPVLNKIVNPVIDFPLCSKCDIICRHSCRHALIPTSESITRLSRRAERYRRAVTGIDGFYAVAAVKIQAEHIIVAVILYLNYRAAISRYINIGIVVKRREATIFLFRLAEIRLLVRPVLGSVSTST